jgi:hypothetical protein
MEGRRRGRREEVRGRGRGKGEGEGVGCRKLNANSGQVLLFHPCINRSRTGYAGQLITPAKLLMEIRTKRCRYGLVI